MKDLWERNQEDIEVWIENMIECLSHLTLHLPIIYTHLLHSLQGHRLYCNISLISAIVRAPRVLQQHLTYPSLPHELFHMLVAFWS